MGAQILHATTCEPCLAADEALELYREQQASKIDTARYLYIPVLGWNSKPAPTEDGPKKPSCVYKR